MEPTYSVEMPLERVMRDACTLSIENYQDKDSLRSQDIPADLTF